MMQPDSEQWEIENNWTISKLLITNMNTKMFMFRAGQYDIYVQSVRPIPSKMERDTLQWRFDKPRIPHIAVVRSKGKQPVLDLIGDCPELQISRIFKSGLYFPDLNKTTLRGFFLTATKNMMGLRPGTSFYIKSSNKELRDQAYECATLINDEDKMGCTFDYDSYDYTFLIKNYKRKNGTYGLITVLYGWDMPNHWTL